MTLVKKIWNRLCFEFDRLLKKSLPVTELIFLPLVFLSALLLRFIKRRGIQFFPRSRNLMQNMGVFPIHKHYHEPEFDHRKPSRDFSEDRNLPGLNLDTTTQLQFLNNLIWANELENIPNTRRKLPEFHFNNSAFEPGDAEFWYQLIRYLKPKNLIEIGSGFSTLMAIKAIKKNQTEDVEYRCNHLCIEPFEAAWLENEGITVIRKLVEDVELSLFESLGENDILFIDSTHIIKPQGDVLYEYLEILPSLKSGVYVHIHDIFTPKNYLTSWLKENVFFWNEQYLLEAFLTENQNWEVIGALNYLHHHHHAELKKIAPYLNRDHQPGSFYIRKI